MQYPTYAVPRADLGQAMYEYMIGNIQFIGTQALPVLPVPRQAATLSVITREQLLRTGDLKRAIGGTYNEDDISGEDLAYACEEYGKVKRLDDSQRALYANDFDAGLVTSQAASFQLLLAQEIRIATALFNTVTWTGATLYTDVSANPWSTATSDVVGQIMAAKERSRILTGMEPNALICSQQNFNYLKNNDDLVGRVANVSRADDPTMAAAIAPLLGVQRLLVGQAYYNSADEGAAISLTAVWSNTYAMVATISGGSLVSPGVGYCPLWTADSPTNIVVEQYRDEDRRSDKFRVRHYVDELITDPSFGHLLKVA